MLGQALRLLASPLLDRAVVAREQDLRHQVTVELRRTGVLRVFEEPGRV